MVLREVCQVDKNVMSMDFSVLLGEVFNSKLGNGGSLIIISPWIGDVIYYLGCCGFYSNIPLVFGDYIYLSELIDDILSNKNSIVKIVIERPNKKKYESFAKSFDEREIDFLVDRFKKGAEIYFSKLEHGILHPKIILGTYGVVFGSFNVTFSGRYWNIEDGNFAPSTSKVYKEKKKRCEEIIETCEEVTIEDLEKIGKNLSKIFRSH